VNHGPFGLADILTTPLSPSGVPLRDCSHRPPVPAPEVRPLNTHLRRFMPPPPPKNIFACNFHACMRARSHPPRQGVYDFSYSRRFPQNVSYFVSSTWHNFFNPPLREATSAFLSLFCWRVDLEVCLLFPLFSPLGYSRGRIWFLNSTRAHSVRRSPRIHLPKHNGESPSPYLFTLYSPISGPLR